MFEQKELQSLNDYFLNLNSRNGKFVYFTRINGYNSEVGEFIRRYYDAARRSGVVSEGRIPNPDEKNLA